MGLKYHCLFFVLQLHIAASISIQQSPAISQVQEIAQRAQKIKTAITVMTKVQKIKTAMTKVQKIKTFMTKLQTLKKNAKPGNVPKSDMMEPGLSYLPEGAGCTSQPEWAKTAKADTPAIKFNVSGWNGFCQNEMPLCPDAIANKDYSYYWRGLGPNWVKFAGAVDKEYCRLNGWLKPEIRATVNDFAALQAKGEEECKTKWNKPEYQLKESGLNGIGPAIKQSVKDWTGSVIKRSLLDVLLNFTSIKTGLLESVKGSHVGDVLMSEHGAGMGAAWNCAMGSVSCDIAYCNHAYCEKDDGTVGTMEECQGWDRFKGMPALVRPPVEE